jgi:hypothetical protein
MPLPLPPQELIDTADEAGLSRGTGLIIAFGIGALSWAVIVATALLLLRH